MTQATVPYLLRDPAPGDLGWIVQRHGAVYAAEYGWDQRFEAIVARIVADFVDHFDEQHERCWIAEMDGRNVGSVMLVKETESVARLRLLLVEPQARGMRLGVHLVEECVAFAREASFDTVTLWTSDVLIAARSIYQNCGFELESSTPNSTFDSNINDEVWTLDLSSQVFRR